MQADTLRDVLEQIMDDEDELRELTPTRPNPNRNPCLPVMYFTCLQADTLREMLEQIMDDEDELRELNLSSRPRREERRKQRERDRMERQLTR